jgi:hypothetical protein
MRNHKKIFKNYFILWFFDLNLTLIKKSQRKSKNKKEKKT